MTARTPQGSLFGRWPMSQVYGVGCVVKVANPQPTEWKIDEIVREDIQQLEQSEVHEDVQSFASLKVLCHQVNTHHLKVFCHQVRQPFAPKTRAMMRIYYQIPWTNTDGASPKARATQAASMRPSELVAYQTLSKDPHASKFTPRLLGFEESKQQASANATVPGGFVVIVVWEVVPGLRLGDHSGPVGSWSTIKSREERDLVRACFQKTLLEISNAGILPLPYAALNLVWHRQSKTLYWVRFGEFSRCESAIPWDPSWLAMFKLVKWPPNEKPLDPDWNGDTSNWEW